MLLQHLLTPRQWLAIGFRAVRFQYGVTSAWSRLNDMGSWKDCLNIDEEHEEKKTFVKAKTKKKKNQIFFRTLVVLWLSCTGRLWIWKSQVALNHDNSYMYLTASERQVPLVYYCQMPKVQCTMPRKVQCTVPVDVLLSSALIYMCLWKRNW